MKNLIKMCLIYITTYLQIACHESQTPTEDPPKLEKKSALLKNPRFDLNKFSTPHDGVKIIAYFNENAEEEPCICDDLGQKSTLSDRPVKNGYYRKLLARNEQGQVLVQNFFQNSHHKQSDPYIIHDPLQQKKFSTCFGEGPVKNYYETGALKFSTIMYSGIESEITWTYYPDGKVAERQEVRSNGTYIEELWYPNDQRASIYESTLAESKYEPIQGKFWNEKGKIIQDPVKKQAVIDQIIYLIRDHPKHNNLQTQNETQPPKT